MKRKKIFKIIKIFILICLLLALFVAASFIKYYVRFNDDFTSLVGTEWTSITIWNGDNFDGDSYIELTDDEIAQVYALLADMKISFYGRRKTDPLKAPMGEYVLTFELNGHTIRFYAATPKMQYDGMEYDLERLYLDDIKRLFAHLLDERGVTHYITVD